MSTSREVRAAWLRDRLLYAIQFHMWADATAAEVDEVIESLSDSDEYDPNVAALVQMPKWCSPCEAQQGVDAFFASPQTLPAPGEVELREAFRNAARGYGRAGTADLPGGPDMSMDDAANVYAELAANTQGIVALVQWARDQQAFPKNSPGGSGRGHIDENHRFRLRDMVAAIDIEPSTAQIDRIKEAVEQYRNAPFRSADWLAGELMTILDTEAANDRN